MNLSVQRVIAIITRIFRLDLGTEMRTVLTLLVIWTALAAESLSVAQAAPARSARVSVSYVPPKNPAHETIYRRLQEVRFLEKLQTFLSPFRLPRTLLVKTEGCDGDPNASYEDDVIVICYEYIDEIWKTVPAEVTAAGVRPVDALVGPIFDTCLHEFGHAIFDMLQVPVLGREEDAADQISAYIMLHLGKPEARRMIAGTAYAFKTEALAATSPPKMTQFADVHGTPAQRMYNLLCIAYGADAKLFADVVEKGYLPKDRAEDCEDEYRQVARAFAKLIGPHVDRARAKRVLESSWLPAATTRIKRRPGTKPSTKPS